MARRRKDEDERWDEEWPDNDDVDYGDDEEEEEKPARKKKRAVRRSAPEPEPRKRGRGRPRKEPEPEKEDEAEILTLSIRVSSASDEYKHVEKIIDIASANRTKASRALMKFGVKYLRGIKKISERKAAISDMVDSL